MALRKYQTAKPLRSPLVLYIDDEETDLFFMRLAFEKVGFPGTLLTFTDGQEAIDFLSAPASLLDYAVRPPPDLIILDLKLLGVSGFELVEWLRRQSLFRDIPIVVFSGFPPEIARNRALQLGAAEFIEKPWTGSAFDKIASDLVRRWLQPARAAAPPCPPACIDSQPRLE
jgi:CheY-like chemotaxis protein